MRFFSSLLLAAPLAAAVLLDRNGKIVYDGYKVFRVNTPEEGIAALDAQIAELEGIDVHRHADHFDVAIPPANLEAFGALNLDAQVLSEDLGELIAGEGEIAEYEGTTSMRLSSEDGEVSAAALPSLSWFSAYHAYDAHLTFLRDLQGAFPSNSEIITAGTSVQGRTITGIHLWGSGGKGSKPAIYFNGNVHAREWITSKVAEYLAYQLVVNYNNDTAVKAVLDKYDFYILPIVNPDGFVYTQTTDRLWRKNRQTRSGTSAVGTDINRNWPYQWVGSGSSTSPSSETYRGVAAGDTPENTGIRKFGDTLAAGKGIKLYIDWHSYGQYILFPYGYSCSAQVSNYSKQQSLAQSVASQIRSLYSKSFTYGPICTTLYAANGGSTDYMQDVAKTELAWTIELRDTGSYGFNLPASQILQSGQEQWKGQLWLWQNM
ncbi:uncharacterized protein B0I36DRAFT_380267 [Microdochium trichocladiopsis]|uniref:Peptidase M14 domain-containing protein n=1 Tax=Microdochium trichocladiopsis TaxID=1682393 RepID=A0A9P8YJQ1_9PEZI|nr:uncharacterized protein B0I36DRAFT_380267 [Microdochium trichocladiopsis]KAH7041540.1 hypothetical protein B0I36DRAFT_380267 [Microdochium trichocladiopsis]